MEQLTSRTPRLPRPEELAELRQLLRTASACGIPLTPGRRRPRPARRYREHHNIEPVTHCEKCGAVVSRDRFMCLACHKVAFPDQYPELPEGNTPWPTKSW